MFKKVKILLLLAALGATAAGAAACGSMDIDGQMQAQGYVVSVTYDANGGSYFGSTTEVTITDYFNPSLYASDEDGEVSIPLTSPTDEDRPSGIPDTPVSVANRGYTLAGWYRERTPRTNAAGDPIDFDGNVLHEDGEGGYYYIAADGSHVEAVPSYTYSGYWDFEKDVITYSPEDGVVEMTLYACWIPSFEFRFYYRDEEGGWTLYDDSQSFSYINSAAGADTIWMPDWSDYSEEFGPVGEMEYEHEGYEFPSREGYTFEAAYTDPECTQEIGESLVHGGSFDVQTGLAEDRIQNIYVEFTEGTRYRIDTAERLSQWGDAQGYYEILADLDFKAGAIYGGETGEDADKPVAWPAALSSNTFTGKFVSEGGNFTISNVSVTLNPATGFSGGLFGAVAKDAQISGITFENIYVSSSTRDSIISNVSLGLFAGNIEEGASISVTVGYGQLNIGFIRRATNFSFNVLAGGDVSGITHTGKTDLYFTGELQRALQNAGDPYHYQYGITFNTAPGEDGEEHNTTPICTVEADGNIKVEFGNFIYALEPYYQIEY